LKTQLSEIVLTIEDINLVNLFGAKNSKLNIIKNAFPDVNITARGNNIKIQGEKKITQKVKSVFEKMIRLIKDANELSIQVVQSMVEGDNPFDSIRISNGSSDNKVIVHAKNGRSIKPKTKNQMKLFEASEIDDIVFAVGPAGTGKTYVAVAIALRALKNKLVKKIILTRPAVEAGESLGFLPGDLKDKVDPYLRPLYDALFDMLPKDKLEFFMANGVIEVAPLAFMRGRTLDHAFIILDEAQNTTSMQLKMFLTRLGPSAKCIITGDLSQIDLPRHQKSGLRTGIQILKGTSGISFMELTDEDVVRHRLVKKIILAYNKESERKRREHEDNEKDTGE